MGTEARPGSDASNKPVEHSNSAGAYVWNALEHMSGVSTIKAIMHTDSIQNKLHDFQLIDDGTSGFNDLARKHVEKVLSGTQRKNLDNERDSYNWKLAESAIPTIFSPGVPEKGPLMKQFDSTVDTVVTDARKRVERAMTSDEMKQYQDEVTKYKWAEGGSMVLGGVIGGALMRPEKGPMMIEYEKRVAKEIDKGNVSWQDKNS